MVNKHLYHLAIGEEMVTRIRVNRDPDEIGIQVAAGEVYSMIAGGWWVDGYILRNPAGDVSDLGLINVLLKPLLREPASPWCALIGVVVGCDERHQFPIGRGVDITTRIDGELCCYVNDVPGFFWNNFGSLRLTLRRMACRAQNPIDPSAK